ncbi:MAG: ROK family protein [Planctomycetota bacterium]|nr:ROK family protein [Planctomycetota bacterium]
MNPVPPAPFVVGLDLGGTSVKGIAVRADGTELARRTAPFDLAVPMAFACAVRDTLAALESAVGYGCPASRVGLSAPGLAAPDARSIAFMPGRFEGLENLDWARHLGLPVLPVLNDAHAALLGEVWQGAARDARNVILLTLGTGVGGAAMVDGRLLRGRSGKAGHLGHVCLNPDGAPGITRIPGSLEDAIGNHNIAARSGGRFATTHDLVAAHEAGDPFARTLWLRSVKALAAAVASLTNVLDPEVVIIGGGIARAGDTLLAPLRETVSRFEWKVCGHEVRIVPALLGDFAGAWGAARNTLPTDP